MTEKLAAIALIATLFLPACQRREVEHWRLWGPTKMKWCKGDTAQKLLP
jgi:hypothetical protein